MKSKLHNLVFLLIFLSSSSIAQLGQWAWISGDSICNSTIVNYGVQGIASSSNIPAPTYEGANWTDSQGRFWFFGGVRTTALFNDLWMFDPSIKQWTWIKGPQVGGGRDRKSVV